MAAANQAEPRDQFEGIDCWSARRIIEHIQKGWIVPPNWRERLTSAGWKVTAVPTLDADTDTFEIEWGTP